MTSPTDDDLSDLIRRARSGDGGARDQLVAALYDDFRAIATRRMSRERRDHTLQATALVHEALAKLWADGTFANATDHAFLLKAASKAMGQVLIDHHRHRAALKGPGRHARTELDEVLDRLEEVEHLTFTDLHHAIEEFERVDSRAALAIRFHYFLGMSQADVGGALEISQKTVERDLKFARGWLHSRLRPDEVP
jgi:RNA polymerase sigma factor (TIGR02999 family)